MPKSLLSRRAFLQTTAAAAGATLASNSIGLDAEPSYAAWDAFTAKRPRPLRHCRRGDGRQRRACNGRRAARHRMRCSGRSLRRPPHPGPRNCRQAHQDHAPLPGTARRQEHRRNPHRRPRPLAQAGRGRRARRRQGRVLRKTHVAQSGRWPRHGGGSQEDRSHRADRRAAHQFRALRQGQGDDRERRDRRPESD